VEIKRRESTAKPLGVCCLVVQLLTLGAGVSPGAAEDGSIEEAGPELWIDGPAAVDFTGDDRFPDVGVDESGRRIYVWTNFFPTNPERGEIILRRFDSEDNPLEVPRVINSTSDNTQDHPRVAIAADGTFLVAWESEEFDADDNTNRRYVRSQLFAATGVASGSEQLVSASSGDSAPISVDVAALRVADGSSGGFVAVWDSFNTAGSDNSGSSIQAQMISAAGVPTGAPFQVNTTIGGSQRDAAVAELPDGGFLVVWGEPGVQGQRFSGAGAPDGPQFQINTEFAGVGLEADVAIGWDGVVAVVWEDSDESGNAEEIRARLFRSDLSPLGSDFRVNSLLSGDQELPRIGDDGPMGFQVTWQSESSVGGDTSESIQTRLVTGPNQFDGPQTQLNVYEDSFQDTPASHGWYGQLGAVWRSDGNDQDPPPTDDHITGRQSGSCSIYCDDLEWGSTWRWSVTVQ